MEKKLLALLTSLERLRSRADARSHAQVEDGRKVEAVERANSKGASDAYQWCIYQIRNVLIPDEV